MMSTQEQQPPTTTDVDAPADVKDIEGLSSHVLIDVPRDEEKRLLKKMDWLLLPVLAFMLVQCGLRSGWC